MFGNWCKKKQENQLSLVQVFKNYHDQISMNELEKNQHESRKQIFRDLCWGQSILSVQAKKNGGNDYNDLAYASLGLILAQDINKILEGCFLLCRKHITVISPLHQNM